MFNMIFNKCIALISMVSILGTSFSVDSTKLSFSKEKKEEKIVKNFNDDYNLSKGIETSNGKLEKEIEESTKRMTYLLLGEPSTKDESAEVFYKRKQEYLDSIYRIDVPDEGAYTADDKYSEERAYNMAYEMRLSGLFININEMDIKYNSLGNIRVAEDEDEMMSMITIPNVTMKTESDEDPMEYVIEETNLVLYYFFKKNKDKYEPFWMIAETNDTLEEYFTEVEETEDNLSTKAAPTYDSQLKDVYDFSKVEAISEEQVTKIQESNENNILILNSYYNNRLVTSANGFFINEGLLVTTWNFIEQSLMEAQFIAIKDSSGNSYEMDGIVTANPETDVAVIKLKEKTTNKVTLGDSSVLKKEDPIFSISSKTGVGLTTQAGIVISNDGYIGSAIPLTSEDEGSPLINSDGKVVGMNTAEGANTSIAMSINSEVLKEVQDKFSKTKFENIDAISFEKMKSDFYYVKYNEENVKNSIPKDKWKTISKIGNIEKKIPLKLVKASYRDDIASMRYYNGISNYVDNMQLSAGFREQLVKEGYKEKVASSKKYIYENKEYKVIIMSEFNYIIVVMVKL